MKIWVETIVYTPAVIYTLNICINIPFQRRAVFIIVTSPTGVSALRHNGYVTKLHVCYFEKVAKL